MEKCTQVFILGAPRSGTTFLASLLELTFFGKPVETHFITKYYKQLADYGDIAEKENFKKLLTDILNERPIQQWKLNLDIDAFYSDLEGDFAFSNIVNHLCLKRNKPLGLNAWGDKTPHYLGDFDIIHALFPHAKFIYIVRDGRDVALSLLEKNWGPNNIYACAKYWKKLNVQRSEYDRLEQNGQLLKLSYEDLLDNTEENVENIYDFLSQSYDKSAIQKICATVRKGNYNKWESLLSKKQIRVFDSVAANTLQRLGYKTFDQERELSVFSRFYYTAQDKAIWLKFMFDSNVIDGFKIKFLGKEPFAE